MRIWKRTYSGWFVDYTQQHDSTVHRLFFLALIATVGMPLYYVVWAYWFPQPYENIGLRIFGVVFCFPAIFAKRFTSQKWLPVYFFLGLTYVLPFFFTFMYLMNGGSSVWSESLLIALILLFHFDTTLAFLAYLAGTGAAYLAYIYIHKGWVPMNTREFEQWPIQIFAIITVSLAKIGRKVLLQQKLEGMSSALATVAHELRTPLLSIDANIRGIKRIAQESTSEPSIEDARTEQAILRIEFEVRSMNSTIDLLLLNASGGNSSLSATDVLSMETVVKSMLQRYPFVNEAQKELVSVVVRSDFFFRGKSELSTMVILNLLSNSFKAIHRAGKGRVKIIIDGSHSKNTLYFIDTGCGIGTIQLPLIYKRFYTYPEHTGTGIGLSFCKEVIEAWGGRIHCSSKIGSHTVFVLEFPDVT